MFSRAIAEINSANQVEEARRRAFRELRGDVDRLDLWLDRVERMLEDDRPTVPQPLVEEMAEFLMGIDPKLHRDLLRIRSRNAVRVLDILFEAQEQVLPRAGLHYR